MVRIYGKDCIQIKQIYELIHKPAYSNRAESNVRKRKEQASVLTESLIKDIKRFGIPKTQPKEEKNGFHINITQSQNQKTQISLNLLIESIQEELKGSQLKELQTIIDDTETETSEKKNKIIDTLKKFGSDVATNIVANIVANILTNPNLSG